VLFVGIRLDFSSKRAKLPQKKRLDGFSNHEIVVKCRND